MPDPPGDLPDPGIETVSPVSPALAGGFFFFFKATETLGNPPSKKRRKHENLPPLSARAGRKGHVGTSKNVAVCKPGRGPHQELKWLVP